MAMSTGLFLSHDKPKGILSNLHSLSISDKEKKFCRDYYITSVVKSKKEQLHGRAIKQLTSTACNLISPSQLKQQLHTSLNSYTR